MTLRLNVKVMNSGFSLGDGGGSWRGGDRGLCSLPQQFLISSFGTVLLEHNSHPHAIHSCKGTIQWFLVYSQSCATHTAINFTILPSPPKEPLAITSLTPHLPQPLEATNVFAVSMHLPSLDMSQKWPPSFFAGDQTFWLQPSSNLATHVQVVFPPS